MAQIILIRPLELIVSLPNQLLGHIPITNISAEYTARLEASAETSSEDEVEDEDEAASAASKTVEELPSLFQLFSLGQWLSCVVVESKSRDSKSRLGGREGDENVRASRRIELSTEPERVNEGIARGDLRTGFVSFVVFFFLLLLLLFSLILLSHLTPPLP